jgi:DHA2 family methylenomycin A resistance protein-like MFS transporter
MRKRRIQSEYKSSFHRWLTLMAMSLGFGVVQLDVTIVNTALGSMGTALGGGVAELQWVVSSYTIAFAALILTAGALGDRIGAKRVFMVGFSLFTFASLGCALAADARMLIGARAIQGVAAALLVPNSLALLNHAYREEHERARAVGIWAAGASLALTAGPLLGGVLIALFGWRSIFLVNLPIGLAGLWLAWRFAIDSKPAPDRELDLIGQGTAIGALGCLAAALIEAGTFGWTSMGVLGGFAAAAACALGFVWRERRTLHPMLPLQLFSQRTFSLTSAVGLLVNMAFYGLIFVFSLYFQQLDKFSPLATGLAFIPMMGAVLPMNLLAARAAARFGAPPIVACGAALSAAGCLLLVGLRQGTAYGLVCIPLMLIGAGLGLLVPPLTSSLLGSVEKARSGIAAAVLNATRQTGSVLGVALFGSLIGRSNAFLPGLHESLLISGIILVAAAASMLLGGEVHSQRRAHRAQAAQHRNAAARRRQSTSASTD